MSAHQIKWDSGPASLPTCAEAAVLDGDPGKKGPFTFRLKMPKGYHIPPDTHPKPEVVTVISGTFSLGMGENADKDKAQALPADSFFDPPTGRTLPFGSWSLTSVNPADDPRKQ